MTEDYFWGVSLGNAMKELKWEPDALKENGGAGDISLIAKGEHTLLLKQALLGSDVKDGEVNVIEVETSGLKGNVKVPIVSLVGGKSNHVLLDLNFPDPPVTLRLIEGNGPVYIAGNHVINAEQYNDDDDDDEDDDLEDFDEPGLEDDDEEEEVEAEKKKEEKGGKKRTSSSSGQSQPKKKKKNAKDD